MKPFDDYLEKNLDAFLALLLAFALVGLALLAVQNAWVIPAIAVAALCLFLSVLLRFGAINPAAFPLSGPTRTIAVCIYAAALTGILIFTGLGYDLASRPVSILTVFLLLAPSWVIAGTLTLAAKQRNTLETNTGGGTRDQ